MLESQLTIYKREVEGLRVMNERQKEALDSCNDELDSLRVALSSSDQDLKTLKATIRNSEGSHLYSTLIAGVF